MVYSRISSQFHISTISIFKVTLKYRLIKLKTFIIPPHTSMPSFHNGQIHPVKRIREFKLGSSSSTITIAALHCVLWVKLNNFGLKIRTRTAVRLVKAVV